MPKHIRVLTILFDAEIQSNEIPLFRGAVIACMKGKADLLFHNHIDEKKLRYGYPKIQYKRIGGKAAIVCVENGADTIGQFFSEYDGKLTIGEREIICSPRRISPTKILVQTWSTPFQYHVRRWLPLNAKNYQHYKTIESVTERVAFLEDIMKANLLAMLKGFDIHLDDELTVEFTQISEPYLQRNKGIKLMAFNVDFKSNLSIPNNIGIGKNASIGFGTVTQERREKSENIDKTENNDN